MKRIEYKDLNSKQKETYNYHKLSSVLADYGYFSMRISDDWQSADFIAMHCIDKSFIKVQLKSRLSFSKKYINKDLYIAFEDKKNNKFYLYPHDELLMKICNNKIKNIAWDKNGDYSAPSLSKLNSSLMNKFELI
jgi:hypothetical protein